VDCRAAKVSPSTSRESGIRSVQSSGLFSIAVLYITAPLVVVLIGLGIVFSVMLYGLCWSAGAVTLAIAGVLLVVPKWLC
jgi:hypothetical protein